MSQRSVTTGSAGMRNRIALGVVFLAGFMPGGLVLLGQGRDAQTKPPLKANPPPGETGLIYPLVPGHGGVVPLPRAAEQPRKGARAVFDITADAKPGEVNRGLEQVARLLNLYGAAGLQAGDVKIAAVFHSQADKAVLSDAA